MSGGAVDDGAGGGADPLTIRTDRRGGTTTVALAGDLDLLSAPHARAALIDAHLGGGDTVVVDLAGVPYADSAGLGVLVSSHKRLAVEGRRLVLRRPGVEVVRLLELTGLDEVLHLER